MACAGSAMELALENAPDQQRLSKMELLHERSTEENAGVRRHFGPTAHAINTLS